MIKEQEVKKPSRRRDDEEWCRKKREKRGGGEGEEDSEEQRSGKISLFLVTPTSWLSSSTQRDRQATVRIIGRIPFSSFFPSPRWSTAHPPRGIKKRIEPSLIGTRSRAVLTSQIRKDGGGTIEWSR